MDGNEGMGTIPLKIIVPLAAAVTGQLITIGLLPRTSGFTVPFPTVGCVTAVVFSLWMTARIAHSGVNIGILIPFMAAIVPLAAVLMGAAAYGEELSFLKVAILAVACSLIGVASRLP